jgi:hydrogenase maturation protease
VVIGVGNTSRGDDGAGWRVAESVLARGQDQPRVLLGQQVVPEWAPILAEAATAYFVDADPSVQRLTLTTVPRSEGAVTLGAHAFGPAALLRLARALYGRAPRAYLVRVPATSFDFGEQLSPGTEIAVTRAISLLLHLGLAERASGEAVAATR